MDARVVTAEDQEIRRHIVAPSGLFRIETNEKKKSGYYMYAFLLSSSFPLPDGHQAVELKLQNGRRVLIETNDAENFIAALRKNGVG